MRLSDMIIIVFLSNVAQLCFRETTAFLTVTYCYTSAYVYIPVMFSGSLRRRVERFTRDFSPPSLKNIRRTHVPKTCIIRTTIIQYNNKIIFNRNSDIFSSNRIYNIQQCIFRFSLHTLLLHQSRNIVFMIMAARICECIFFFFHRIQFIDYDTCLMCVSKIF